ncbi:leucine---tRNA ligase [Spizellomyces sp. 'palustris']|nr:leucine---tRNA ligase [Spizellomyces sp. 'palustris']
MAPNTTPVTVTSTTSHVTVAEERKGTAKLEALQKAEEWAQQKWDSERPFEVNAPAPGETLPPKFMGTFPFPYMNGMLHLGHSFSLSKLEFASGYERLKGKRVLFPFGFHVTGMPIKACADKLKKEIGMFGPDFEGFKEEDEAKEEAKPVVATAAPTDPTKITKKHGKANAKSTGLKYQFQIMRSMGIPNDEIKNFADSKHWLYYFPPMAIEDLKAFGLSVDWRRSFFTTDINPYFDSFVRWQFHKLRSSNPAKVKFGERYTIYSPLDGQPCMDHDRATGEGVGVQEYTGIKLQVLLKDLIDTPETERDEVKGVPVGKALTSPQILEALGNRKLYLVAATLRPETMYGQTNCFVGVDIMYGIYAVNDSEAWVCTERSARNMAFQKLFQEVGVIKKLGELKGSDLIGVPLNAPLSKYEKVYTLPMEGVLVTKGTGVVTSVPSDSPDDYITLQDLKKKAAYYNVQPKWVEPFFDSFPSIIRTPNYGDRAAETAVKKLKINSQKDKVQLAEAKAEVYKEGFYQGTMIVGDFAGKSVQEAKTLIRAQLIEEGVAFPYCEPEGLVVSRSGDECVVTLAPQWYMDYGEESWKKLAEECLANMETFSTETRNQFEKTLDWLSQWACSRSFGLGSRLPWDPQYLIESLSDSTIYMAYYTVSHLLHGGTLDGSKPGAAKVKAEQMTDDVWDYILLDGPKPADTIIPQETLDRMRREFKYFYPLDLRVSGKDLVNNHLSFFIYNHTAIFPKESWPKGVRANGHLLLNNEKMSKSTGNFMTLRDALKVYGADATRFALADAGDGVEDANFLEKTADDAILKLFTEREWVEEVLTQVAEGKMRQGAYSWNDTVFEAEINKFIGEVNKAYTGMLYRDALKLAFYELSNARSEYRKATTGQGVGSMALEGEAYEGMHEDLIVRYIEVQALMLAPITPHWSEHIWSNLLKKPESIKKALWPKQTAEPNESLLAAAAYIRGMASKVRSAEDQAARKKQKKGAVDKVEKIGKLRLYVASSFPAWQDEAVAVLRETWDESTGKFQGNEKQALIAKGLMKNKAVMPFIASIKQAVDAQGPVAFDRKLSFNELETLQLNLDYIRRELAVLKVTSVELVDHKAAAAPPYDAEDAKKADNAVPGQPTYRLL